MNLKFSMINDPNSLVPYKNSILELFRDCFNKELDPTLWDWAYCNNPAGNPIVSLCHANDKLVGHYAVIPFNLIQGEDTLPACLSMTTMVEASCRKFGLFVEQAQQVYQLAQELGFGVVFGFPNANSTPGFRKRLGWILDEPDYIACVTLKQLSDSLKFRELLSDPSLVKLDIDNRSFMQWRLSKPGQVYRNSTSLIFKEFGSEEDIVKIMNLPNKDYDDTKRYNILLDAAVTDLRKYEVSKYQFGYKVLDTKFRGIKFKKDMLLSDVF